MAGGTEFNWANLKELVLYLSQQSLEREADPRFGYVKLNKLLFRADTEAFRRLGRSITGETYIKQDFGPVASHLPIALEELGRAGYLAWRFADAGEYVQKIPSALEPPDMSQFSADQLTVIEQTLQELLPYTGKGVSEWSHEESAGWRVAEINNEIPYETSIIASAKAKPPDEAVEQLRQRVLSGTWD
jgi:hypothetical protein